MNRNSSIGIIDSGMGGLSVLASLIKNYKNERFIYIGDNANAPYGRKSKEEILNLTSNIVEMLIKEDVKVIVIACNTITTNCIEDLRKSYPSILFIGMKPVVKIAHNLCDTDKKMLVLATMATLNSSVFYEEIQNINKDDYIAIDGNELVKIVELNHVDDEIARKTTFNILKDIDKSSIGIVVLGCTHFLFLRGIIQKLLPNAKIIDSNLIVINDLDEVLRKSNLNTIATNQEFPNYEIRTTSGDKLVHDRALLIFENYLEKNHTFLDEDSLLKVNDNLSSFLDDYKDEKGKRILNLRYGIDNNRPLSKEEVARIISSEEKISKEEIELLEKEMYNKMKKKIGD